MKKNIKTGPNILYWSDGDRRAIVCGILGVDRIDKDANGDVRVIGKDDRVIDTIGCIDIDNYDATTEELVAWIGQRRFKGKLL
jgi:hypothetical protein